MLRKCFSGGLEQLFPVRRTLNDIAQYIPLAGIRLTDELPNHFFEFSAGQVREFEIWAGD